MSRLVLGDTTKCSFKHMDTMYGLIHTYRVNNEDMTKDQLRKKRSNKRYNLDQKVETLAAIQAFMLHTIRQIKADAYMVYPGNPKRVMLRISVRYWQRLSRFLGRKSTQSGNDLH